MALVGATLVAAAACAPRIGRIDKSRPAGRTLGSHRALDGQLDDHKGRPYSDVAPRCARC